MAALPDGATESPLVAPSVIALCVSRIMAKRLLPSLMSTRDGRCASQFDVRERAYAYVPDEPRHYFAQLHAYQIMPDAGIACNFVLSPCERPSPRCEPARYLWSHSVAKRLSMNVKYLSTVMNLPAAARAIINFRRCRLKVSSAQANEELRL